MKKVMWIVSIFSVIMTAIAVQFMPDSVPMHYNMAGEIDRWGSKYENFIFAAIIIVFSLVWSLLIAYYEKKASKSSEEKVCVEALSNAKVIKVTGVSMAVMETVLHGYCLYKDCKIANADVTQAQMNISKLICILIGLLFIVLGNFIPKVKNNTMIGIRTKWSMYNDVTWMKSNRFGGVTLMITGVLVIMTSVFVKEPIAIICMLIYTLVDTLITVFFSYKVYKGEVKSAPMVEEMNK